MPYGCSPMTNPSPIKVIIDEAQQLIEELSDTGEQRSVNGLQTLVNLLKKYNSYFDENQKRFKWSIPAEGISTFDKQHPESPLGETMGTVADNPVTQLYLHLYPTLDEFISENPTIRLSPKL